MAYTALEDVETGNVLGASLWNQMRDIVALPIQTVQGRGDLITATAANAPARLVFPATPSGQLLGSQGASVGYLSTLTGDHEDDFTPATPEGGTSNDSRVTTFGPLRTAFVGN